MGFAVALAVAPAANGRAAETPAAPLPHVRRSYDFSPPRPGEMLANPPSGVGTPPHLDEFSPVVAADHRDEGAAEGTTRRTDAPANPAGTSAAASAQPAPAPAPAPTPAEDFTPFQVSLAGRISHRGIAGFLASDGNGPAPEADEEPAFERARRELAASLLAWNALYPRPSRMTDVPVDVDITQGRVTFRNAPARMVGAPEPRP